MQTLDQNRVEAFAGQIATEVGAALNAALVTVGDELGLVPRDGRRPAHHAPASSRRAPTRTSATCANGSTRRPQAAS